MLECLSALDAGTQILTKYAFPEVHISYIYIYKPGSPCELWPHQEVCNFCILPKDQNNVL